MAERETVIQLSDEAKQYLSPAQPLVPMIEDAYEIPVAKVIRPWTEVESAKYGIVGVPFDATTIFRRGSRFGPTSVRDALQGCTSFNPSLNVDIAEGGPIADFGNVDVMQTEYQETWKRIETVMTAIFKSGVTPVVIGGDHGNTYPIVRGLANAVNGPIGLILIDAHYDVRVSHHGEVSSGVPFRYLIERLESKQVSGKNFVEIGITGWHNSKTYRDWCEEQGITVIPAREVHRGNLDDIVKRSLEIAGKGTEAIWITLDIDAADVAYGPGTNAPAIGGLTSPQILEMIYQFGLDPKVAGYDVMEVSPYLDSHNMTSELAATSILDFFAARELAKQRTPAAAGSAKA